MQKATRVVRRNGMAVHKVVDRITLARAERYRRRILMRTDGGRELLLDLAEATYLGHGDGLLIEGGVGVVIVEAAAEPLLEIHAADAIALARIAWHIGNRHTPCEIAEGTLYIQPDHVLAEMVRGLGGDVHEVRRPFDPEGGAYGGKGPLGAGHHHHGQHHHGHDHHHGHGSHDHEHGAPEGRRRR